MKQTEVIGPCVIPRKSSKEENRRPHGKFIKFSLGFLLTVISCFGPCACSTKSESNTDESSPKFEQYYVNGEHLYLKNCSNCHQKTGTGLGLVYPPLKKSDYMQHNFEEVVCLIKNGKKGNLLVNGKQFNQAMPAMSSLTDLEIAEIATYIYNTWENQHGIVEVHDVSRILSLCDSVTVSR